LPSLQEVGAHRCLIFLRQAATSTTKIACLEGRLAVSALASSLCMGGHGALRYGNSQCAEEFLFRIRSSTARVRRGSRLCMGCSFCWSPSCDLVQKWHIVNRSIFNRSAYSIAADIPSQRIVTRSVQSPVAYSQPQRTVIRSVCSTAAYVRSQCIFNRSV